MQQIVQELKLVVPTYNAELYPDAVASNKMPEFGPPLVDVLVCESAGVRIVLGTHNYSDMEFPDVQIERQPNGWAIFLHPLGGCDPSGLAYFHDDGRSYLIKDCACGPTPPMIVLEEGEKIPAFRAEE